MDGTFALKSMKIGSGERIAADKSWSGGKKRDEVSNWRRGNCIPSPSSPRKCGDGGSPLEFQNSLTETHFGCFCCFWNKMKEFASNHAPQKSDPLP